MKRFVFILTFKLRKYCHLSLHLIDQKLIFYFNANLRGQMKTLATSNAMACVSLRWAAPPCDFWKSIAVILSYLSLLPLDCRLFVQRSCMSIYTKAKASMQIFDWLLLKAFIRPCMYYGESWFPPDTTIFHLLSFWSKTNMMIVFLAGVEHLILNGTAP